MCRVRSCRLWGRRLGRASGAEANALSVARPYPRAPRRRAVIALRTQGGVSLTRIVGRSRGDRGPRPTGSLVAHRLWAFVFALMVAVPLNLVTSMPTDGVEIESMSTAKWTSEVNGDFIQVGNGVLVCDPTSWSVSFCTALHSGSTGSVGGYPYANDFVNMAYNTSVNSTWINGSSATITVPAGARVAYAKLFWAGSTGEVIRSSSTTLTQPGCSTGSPGLSTYFQAAPAGLSMNTVQLNVNGVTTSVTGTVTRETAAQIATSSQALYYSSDAVVTSAFASLPTGSAQTISVGNVYAPQGKQLFRCMGVGCRLRLRRLRSWE